MTKADQKTMIEAIEKAAKVFQSHVTAMLLETIDAKFESYRRGVTTQSHWCCNSMRTLAQDLWGLSAPMTDEGGFGGITLQLREFNMLYCPFCGAKL